MRQETLIRLLPKVFRPTYGGRHDRATRRIPGEPEPPIRLRTPSVPRINVKRWISESLSTLINKSSDLRLVCGSHKGIPSVISRVMPRKF